MSKRTNTNASNGSTKDSTVGAPGTFPIAIPHVSLC
jgi:hypothetical protein